MKDFSGTENIPFIRCRYEYQNEDGTVETIDYMRHSRPTVGGNFFEFVGGVISRVFCKVFGVHSKNAQDGEEIASDYEEAIRIAENHGEAIFYDDLKFRLNGEYKVKYYTTPCKDFLDRGGNMAMVEDFVHYHMTRERPSSEGLQHTLYTTPRSSYPCEEKASD